MAKYALPLLFINLSGEMVYILDQRLTAQQVSVDKASKVLNDIIGIMFNQRFLEELFKPQEVYNKEALKSVFSDLAHASIMRLNEESMGKLYDLMRMVFKYQVFTATQPRDLLLITLNHMDMIRSLVSSQALLKQLDSAYFLFIKTYGQMGCGELQRLRYHILNFFQDMRIRVSIFMRQKLQNNSGSFVISPHSTVPHGNEIPGSIRIYGKDGCIVDLINFTPGGEFTQTTQVGSLELRGPRHTSLGTNIYSTTVRVESEGWERCGSADYRDCDLYKKELNLLVKQLLGAQTQTQASHEVIKLDLFYDQDNIERETTSANTKRVDTETEPFYTESLHKVMTEMTIGPSRDDTATSVSVVDLLDKFL